MKIMEEVKCKKKKKKKKIHEVQKQNNTEYKK